jgi:GDP-4-dehydro-6-deoxy-D-mannose reductase
MRILVTGLTGFAGSHFAELALRHGASVYGTYVSPGSPERVGHLLRDVRLVQCDLRDAGATGDLLQRCRPDWIVHLAARSFVGDSWAEPAETIVNNVVSQVNLLEAARETTSNGRVLVVGSSDEYGDVEDGKLPITEEHPLRPLSPYAVSKVTQDLMGYQYWRSYGLPVIRSRAFNHEGVRRGDAFVTSTFARQIAEIEAGRREPLLLVGNLKARRDYTDVRDIVRGYWLLLERGEPGEVYNLCSGKAWSIQAVLDLLLAESRVRNIEIREDPARLRLSDVPTLVGDAGKIRRAVGWQPEIPFERTLRDVLAYWRERVARR